jgi:ribosomal protein S18 acetylase RimI-like enzyme
MAADTITIRRARRDDVGKIVAMLADDALGRARERIETPLPESYFQAFARLDADPNIKLVVAEEEAGAVVGCLQLCILPGLSSQGASRGLIEDVRVDSSRRSRGIGEELVRWAVDEARTQGCKLVELLTHNTRVDAQRFYERLGFARSHVGMTIRF